MLAMLECALATLEISHGERGEGPTGPPHGPPAHCTEMDFQWERRRLDSCPAYGTPRDKPMPTEPDLPTTPRTYKPWLTLCALHAAEPPDVPTLAVRVNGILLDSGSVLPIFPKS